MTVCPVCNREWMWRKLLLRLDDNIISVDGLYVNLSVMEARVIKRLMRSPASLEVMFSAVYGSEDSTPITADSCMMVRFNRLRKKLKPLGWTIVNIRAPSRAGAVYALTMIPQLP